MIIVTVIWFLVLVDRQACSNLRKMIKFKYFKRLGLFPQVFGQIKEWLMLKLYEIIRVEHEFACPIVFI